MFGSYCPKISTIFFDETDNRLQEWERRRREAQEDAERRHKRQVDERRERMVLRQQQREEDYRRKKAEHFKDPKIAVKVSSPYIFWMGD